MSTKYKQSGGLLLQSSDVLQALRPNVSPKDKKEAMEKFRLSDTTINNYLNGDVRNLDTAEQLIVFFKQCFVRRQNAIGSAEEIIPFE